MSGLSEPVRSPSPSSRKAPVTSPLSSLLATPFTSGSVRKSFTVFGSVSSVRARPSGSLAAMVVIALVTRSGAAPMALPSSFSASCGLPSAKALAALTRCGSAWPASLNIAGVRPSPSSFFCTVGGSWS